MSSWLIRAPLADEAELLADLHLQAWAETYRGRFPQAAWGSEARDERVKMWERICSSPRGSARFAVAERAGQAVGIAGAGGARDEPRPRELELWFIYLLAREHGSGAGQALLNEVLGTDPACLWVLEGNARAIAFYERNGFVLDGARRPTAHADAGDEVRMLR